VNPWIDHPTLGSLFIPASSRAKLAAPAYRTIKLSAKCRYGFQGTPRYYHLWDDDHEHACLTIEEWFDLACGHDQYEAVEIMGESCSAQNFGEWMKDVVAKLRSLRGVAMAVSGSDVVLP
jgi:hypothetical protein